MTDASAQPDPTGDSPRTPPPPPPPPAPPAAEAPRSAEAPTTVMAPPAPPSAAAEYARSTFTPDLWRRTLLAAAVAVGAPLVLGLVTAVLLVIAVGAALPAGSTTNPLTDGSTAPGVWTLAVAIAGLTMLGDVSITGSASSGSSGLLGSLTNGTSAGASAVFTPLLLTVVVVAVVAWFAWRFAARPAQRRSVRFIEAGVTGLAAAIGIEVLALIGTWHLGVLGYSVDAGTAGLRLFVGAFVVAGAAAFAGSAIAASGASDDLRLRAFAGQTGRGVLRLPAAWRAIVLALVVGAVVAAVAAAIGLLVAGAIQGPFLTVLLTLPLTVGTVAVWLVAVGEFGGITAQGAYTSSASSSSGSGSSSTISVFSGQSPVLWLCVLVAIAIAVLTALVLRRVSARDGRRAPIWVLPVAAAVGWLVLPFVVAMLSAGSVGAIGSLTAGASGSIAVAPWFFLVAGVWALVTDALAWRVLPAWSADARRENRSGTTRLVSLLVLLAIVVVLVAVAVVSLANSMFFSPSAVASRYLGHIASGNLSAARSDVAGSVDVFGGPPAAADRLQNAKVVSSTTSGDGATVEVSYTVGGKPFERTLSLVRSGKTAVLFDDWHLTEPLSSELSVDTSIASGVTVDGTALRSDSLQLYPGVYHLALPGALSGYVSLSSTEVVLGSGGVSVTEAVEPALSSAVQKQVDSSLDTCVAAATDLQPTDCPISVYSYGSDVQDVKWTMGTYPSVSLSDDGTTFTSTGCGSASVTYTYDDAFSGRQSESDSDSCVDVSGDVSISSSGVRVSFTQ